MIVYQGDAAHDDWNCVKGACNNAPWYPWRTVAMLAPIWTIDTAPFGSGAFGKLQAEALQSLVEIGPSSEAFQLFKQQIAADFGVPTPQSSEDDKWLLSEMVDRLRGGAWQEPTMKMSRWFSWMRSYVLRRGVWHSRLAVLVHWHTHIARKASRVWAMWWRLQRSSLLLRRRR